MAPHGMGLQGKIECCDLLPEENFQVEEYEVVALPAYKNGERRSRKAREMEA